LVTEVSKHTQGGFLITRIHHTAKRIFGKKLREYGIEVRPGQGRILYTLWREDGLAIKELVERTGLSKSTLTEMLDALESSGQLARVPSDSDRRVTNVRLTDKTRRAFERYAQVSDEMSRITYSGFTSAEIDIFEDYLRRVLSNLSGFEARSRSYRHSGS